MDPEGLKLIAVKLKTSSLPNSWKTNGKGLLLAVALFLTSLFVWNSRELFNDPLSTAVLDEEGELIGARIAQDGQWRFGTGTIIPRKFCEALLAYEDQRFYQHPGIDVKSMTGALWSQLTGRQKKRGGSTLTMQVMRLSFKNQNRSILSKLEEMAGAILLELTHTKSEILQLYMTNAPFGGNIVGIEAACWRYFGKKADDLSWAEAAMLAVLPNQPSMIHMSKNRPLLQKKRDQLLKKLLNQKILDSLTYTLSLGEPIPEKPLPLPSSASHLVDHLTFSQHKTGIQSTTLKSEIQKIATDVAAKYNAIYKEDLIDHLAILVLDNESSKVIAYLGNVPESPVDMIMAKRSSGSILKPLLYAASLDRNLITPRSLLSDIPIAINGYAPANFDRDFRGAIPADEALQRSLNIPFVLLLRKYGIARFHHELQKAGISTINRSADHYGLSLILGGGEVSLWETCNVYSSMARLISEYSGNGGKYRTRFYTAASMTMPYPEFKEMPTQKSPVLYSAGAAFATAEALKKLGRPDEEGLWEEFSSQHPLAWKTGTSFGHRDAWAIGFDRKYTIGVWVGNASGKARSNLTGIHRAAPVLFDVFNQLPNAQWFDTPWDDLRKINICSQSGYPAKTECPETEEQYLPASCSKHGFCPYHKETLIGASSGKRVMKECLNESPHYRDTFFVLPPAETAFYTRQHSGHRDLPPLDDSCLAMGVEDGKPNFSLIYPSENTRIFLPKDIGGKDQALVFKAHHYHAGSKLYWYLDGSYLGYTLEFHSMKINPQAGKHVLTLSDATGAELHRKFEILER